MKQFRIPSFEIRLLGAFEKTHGAYGTVLQDNLSFQDNLRCFGVNYDMSRITRFLCYFLSLKLASVLSYYAFPSLISSLTVSNFNTF